MLTVLQRGLKKILNDSRFMGKRTSYEKMDKIFNKYLVIDSQKYNITDKEMIQYKKNIRKICFNRLHSIDGYFFENKHLVKKILYIFKKII